MSLSEEVIEATLEADGTLRLSHVPSINPGPVLVTIIPLPLSPRRGMADVLREIAAEQRASGFPGRSAEEIQAQMEEDTEADEERDRVLAAASRYRATGG